MKNKKTHLSINSGSGGDLRYIGDERSDTNEACREKRYCQEKRHDR